jgi:hypothetical protein
MREPSGAMSLAVYPPPQTRLTQTKARTPIRKDAMPTATLHSGLFNNKSTTEPATKVPIHAHQPTNSAFLRFMSVNILGFLGDDERSHACTFTTQYHFTALRREEGPQVCVEVALL